MEKLRDRPRDKKHWNHRIIVYRDDEGNYLEPAAVGEDVELDSEDLKRVEYVIEDTLTIEGASPRIQWGLLVTFYKVDDGDKKCILLSMTLLLV